MPKHPGFLECFSLKILVSRKSFRMIQFWRTFAQQCPNNLSVELGKCSRLSVFFCGKVSCSKTMSCEFIKSWAERIVKVRRLGVPHRFLVDCFSTLRGLTNVWGHCLFLAWFKVAETIWIWLSHFSPVACTPWKPTSTPQEAKKWDPEVDDPLGIGALNPQQPGHVRDLEPTIFGGPIGLTILTHANLTHTWYHDVNPDTVRIDNIDQYCPSDQRSECKTMQT